MNWLQKRWNDGGWRFITYLLISLTVFFQVGIYIVDKQIYFPWVIVGSAGLYVIWLLMAYIFRNNA